MVEEWFVWFLFFHGLIFDSESLISAGLFAIACNLKQMWKKGNRYD